MGCGFSRTKPVVLERSAITALMDEPERAPQEPIRTAGGLWDGPWPGMRGHGPRWPVVLPFGPAARPWAHGRGLAALRLRTRRGVWGSERVSSKPTRTRWQKIVVARTPLSCHLGGKGLKQALPDPQTPLKCHPPHRYPAQCSPPRPQPRPPPARRTNPPAGRASRGW